MLTTIVSSAACPVISFSFISIYDPLDIITVKLLTHISPSNHFETDSYCTYNFALIVDVFFFGRCDMKLMQMKRLDVFWSD